jgi:hypothetical protein
LHGDFSVSAQRINRFKICERLMLIIFLGAGYGKPERFAKSRTSADVGTPPQSVHRLISQGDGGRGEIQREATFGR